MLHHAPTPRGPWTFLNATGNASNPGIFSGGITTNHDHGTNPAPVELPNGTIVVGAHDNKGFYVQVAPSWRGPYRRVPGYLFTFELGQLQYIFEDPFLWWDATAHRWRVFLHTYSRTLLRRTVPVGGVASSLTPDMLGPWRLQSHLSPLYTTHINDTDGGAATFPRRERPKLLLGEDGTPEVLYTAVCPSASIGPSDPLCFTHAQRVARPGPRP